MSSLKASFGLIICPACGAILNYGGMADVEIYPTTCESCGREWQIVNHPDGRTEVRPKTIQ